MDSRSSPLLVTFGTRVSPHGQKFKKSITRSTVVSPVRQTCPTIADLWETGRRLLGDGQCCKLFAVTAIGMWGSTPVRTTGVLVSFLCTATFCVWIKMYCYVVFSLDAGTNAVPVRNPPGRKCLQCDVLCWHFCHSPTVTECNSEGCENFRSVRPQPNVWITGVLVLNLVSITRSIGHLAGPSCATECTIGQHSACWRA